MEAAYGIGVHNRYALFLEDSDDDAADPYSLLSSVSVTTTATTIDHGGVVASAAASAAVGKKSGVAGSGPGRHNQSNHQATAGGAKMNHPGKSLPNQSVTAGQQLASQQKSSSLSESKQNVATNQKDGRQNRSRHGGNQQQQRMSGGGSTGNRENQENRFGQRSQRNFEPKDNDDLKPSKEFRGDKFDNRRNGFARGGGRGGGGASRGGERGGARLGKREFNRHSGSDRSGIKPTEKRDGGGPHNWGKIYDFNDEEELVNGEKSTVTPSAGGSGAGEDGKTGPGEDGAGAGAGTDGENAPGEEEETKTDEPQLKTLDEYKRELEEKRVHTQFNIRKPGEGEDKSKWKKTYVLKKKPMAEEEEIEYEEIEVEDNKRRNRQVLDIEVNFRPVDDGREVVRRGGGRGRGGHSGGARRSDADRPHPARTGGGDQPRNSGASLGNDGGASPATGIGGDVRGGRSGRGGSGEGRGGPGGPAGGARQGRGRERGRMQPAPKFDDPNDFPSLNP